MRKRAHSHYNALDTGRHLHDHRNRSTSRNRTENNHIHTYRTINMPKNNSGFTLIETILYIALLTILLSGAVFASYNLIEGSGRLKTNININEEGGFVLK